MLPILRQTNNWPFRIRMANDLFDREFGRLIRGAFGEDGADGMGAASYPVNIWEDDEAVHVEAELPGFTKEQIDITIEQGTLQITAEREQQTQARSGSPVLMERQRSRYFRSFSLPAAVQDDSVSAKCENGVLYLTLPKRPEVKPRRIKVQ